MMRRYFTISNILSVSRIFLVIPMGWCLLTEFPHHRMWTIGIIVIAVATDFLDGFLARKLHQVTDVGKVIDPIADKIGIGAYAVCIAIAGDVPLWFVVLVLVRDLLIFCGALYIQRNKKIVPQSNWPGKISVSVVTIALFLATFQIEALNHLISFTIWASVVLMAWSTWVYAQRLFIGRNIEAAK